MTPAAFNAHLKAGDLVCTYILTNSHHNENGLFLGKTWEKLGQPTKISCPKEKIVFIGYLFAFSVSEGL